jgi:WD40 repeat protein
VKICKFLEGHDVLVSSDLDGYLNFYSIYPSTVKNVCLARVLYINQNEQIKREGESAPVQNQVAFPIRGIDFNPATMTLFTGDEAGYLQKWDLSKLLTKLKRTEKLNKVKQEQERQASN